MRRVNVCLLVVVAALLARTGDAAITGDGSPIPVRILYDNSGSMYPGYTPPGSPGRRTKADLGVHYFHEYPQFRQWLNDFVRLQGRVDAGSVGMWTFTSGQSFAPSDIKQVHAEVAPRDFSIDSAMQHFPTTTGQNTFLTETLVEFTRGYTGLVWLVTDNIVETGTGEPEAGVARFFRTLNERPEFRAVHLYKYTFADEATGQRAALAVYAILVSPGPVSSAALVHYDRKFEEDMRNAEGAAGRLFPGGEHLKLKDLRVGAIELRATLKLHVEKPGNEIYKEGDLARLDLDGTIKSYLTHHSVTSGQYALSIVTPMLPAGAARRDFGAQPLAGEMFDSSSGEILREIQPGETLPVTAVLKSKEPIRLAPHGLGQRLRLALKIAEIDYAGTVRMTFTDVHVRLRREHMAGIFGIDQASRIFDFQDVPTLDVNPSESPVGFRLRTSMNRGWVLLAIVALLGALVGVAVFALTRTQLFDVKVGAAASEPVALARMRSHSVKHGSDVLGNLSRDFSGAYRFTATTGNAAITVTPAAGEADAWDYRVRTGAAGRLTIRPRGNAKRARSGPSGGQPRPPSLPNTVNHAPPPRMTIGGRRT